jgi:uncharacterized membrane protein
MVMHKKIVKAIDDEPSRSQKFFMLFVIGFFIIVVGIILMVIAVIFGDSSVNFGALIFIGPFPIVVGAGPEAPLMVLFAIILAVLSIVMFLILRRDIERAKT